MIYAHAEFQLNLLNPQVHVLLSIYANDLIRIPQKSMHAIESCMQ